MRPVETYRTGVAVLVALGGLAAGGSLMQRAASAQETGSFDRAQLRRVAQIISRRYVEEIPADRVYRMAIDGMLEELGDPNTSFIDVADATDLEITTTGNYAGLGIRVQMVADWVTVMSVIPGTPAEREGLLPGDRIVGIDGKSVAGWEEVRVIERLRGEEGDPVRVSLGRFGLSEPVELVVIRENIHVPPVLAYRLDDQIGVVQLTSFSLEARAELKQAIERLRDEGATRLIFDLRGNPGGLLEEGVAVSDLFLTRGTTIVTTASRVDDQNYLFRSEHDPTFSDLPMAVLVDGTSASASEIVAGALQDHDRALVVGTPSFGKGSMQTVYAIPGGHHLKLTTANWFTPSGRSIQREHDLDGLPVATSDPAAIDATPVERPDTTGRKVYYTEGGRPVYGGGGIVPDVIVADSATDSERRLGSELKRQALSIRQLAFRFAVKWRAEHPDMTADFVVTPEMRNRFLELLRDEEIGIDDAVYADVSKLIDRFLAVQLANTGFGELESLRRSHQGDPQFERAAELLRGAGSTEELLKTD